MTGSAETQRADPRPAGRLQPTSDRAVAAVAAMEDGRLDDAAIHVAAMAQDSTVERAWRLLLTGRLAMHRSDFAAAQPTLLEASLLAMAESLSENGPPTGSGLHRLAGVALNDLGRVYRRRDLTGPALTAHHAAHRLLQDHGSIEETRESATELGLDNDVLGDRADAERWHTTAVRAAERATVDPHRERAMAWSNLCHSLEKAERYAEAVDAARAARDAWVDHDGGSPQTARAELRLGGCLLQHAASLRERGDDACAAHLAEAIERLGAAHEALLAFGPECAADVRWCAEQLAFANELGATVPDGA
jgi:tetratricopeptide (TPR) repeat protein